MERRTFAPLAVAAGLLVGFLGSIFFYGRSVGLSFPLFIAVLLIVVLALSRPAGRDLNYRNLWPIIPLLFFAAMIAIRDDWMIVMLNVGAVLSLGALALHYLSLQRPLDEATIPEQIGTVMQTGLMVVPSAFIEVGESWAWLRENRYRGGTQFASVIRGSAFALPVVFVFAILLGSADAVFASYVSHAWNGLTDLLGLQLIDDLVGRSAVTLALAGLTTGAISYGLVRRLNPVHPLEAGDNDIDSPSPSMERGLGGEVEKRKPGFKLSMIESTIVLGSIVLLFAVFVLIQFAYFFGGQANIGVEGLTYAQYARRGFFEMVAVSGMTLGIALALDHVTIRQEGRETILFRALSVVLVALTTIMLISASQRMWLYEEAFGFTQLRVYVHLAILWLGVLFGVFVVALFRLKRHVFSFGVLLVIVGYLVSLNLLNVDHYIAERNVARYHDGYDLDIAFLNILSADAVPVILPLYAESEPGSTVNQWAGQWLARQLMNLDRAYEYSTSVFSRNLARDAAYAQLDAIRDSLPTYDYSLYWGSYGSSYDESRENSASGWDYVTGTPSR
jgi:hypothetical protein